MRRYDNAFPTTYDEFKTHYPLYYSNSPEMQAIMQANGEQLDKIQLAIIQAVNNLDTENMDSKTLSRLEKFLYIAYDGSRSLTERRATINSLETDHDHIGQADIKEVLSRFTEGVIDVALVGGTILVTVTRDLSDIFNLKDVSYVLLKRLPAHLRLEIIDNIIKNLWGNFLYKPFSWNDLQNFTWQDVLFNKIFRN